MLISICSLAMLHPFQVRQKIRVVPTFPHDIKFRQDELHPLNLVLVPWLTERSTFIVNNWSQALDPPIHVIVARTDMTTIANSEVYLSMTRHPKEAILDIPNCVSAAIMTYDCYSFRRNQLIRNLDMIRAHEFADMWVLFGGDYEGWSIADYFVQHGYQCSSGMQLQLGDDNPGLETIWFFWMPNRVDVIFRERETTNDAIVLEIFRHDYKEFVAKALDQVRLFPERAATMTRID